MWAAQDACGGWGVVALARAGQRRRAKLHLSRPPISDTLQRVRVNAARRLLTARRLPLGLHQHVTLLRVGTSRGQACRASRVPTRARWSGARPHLTAEALCERLITLGLLPRRADTRRLCFLHRDREIVVAPWPRRASVVRLATAITIDTNSRRRACARLATTCCQGTSGAWNSATRRQVRRAGPPSQNLGALLTRQHALGRSRRWTHRGRGRGARAHVGLHALWKCTARRGGGGGQGTDGRGYTYGRRLLRTRQGPLVHDWPSWARRSRRAARTFPPAGSSEERLWIAHPTAGCAPFGEDLRRRGCRVDQPGDADALSSIGYKGMAS